MHPLSHRLFSHNILMGSKHMLKCAPGTIHLSSIHSRHFHTRLHLFSTNPEKPTSKIPHISLKKHGFCPFAPVMLSRTVHLQPHEGEKTDMDKLAVLKMKLEKAGIACGSCKPGQYSSMLCPQCGGGESRERSFSIFIREDGVDLEVQASVDGKGYSNLEKSSKGKPHRVLTEESLELQPLCDELIAYFAERMISGETLRRNAVMQRSCFGDQIFIAFTYRRNGQLIGCKYRGINKKFWQEKDTEKILYGVDDIKQASDIIIVEGEMDKLSMEEAGYLNCVSVPDGAPSQVSKKELPAEGEDTKYQYLWNCKEYVEKASRIILATDADAPGQALAEELARRLGRESGESLLEKCGESPQSGCPPSGCWRVKWPKKNDTDVCKDANEVLMFLGPEALREVVENAELYPIKGLFRFSDYFDEVDAYYHRSLGFEFGVSTGWMALNELYNVVPGELTIVTGVPNSGKSEWIDALLCNINRSVGWKFVLCSMENKVREHARKLLEKHIRKPFFNARYGESVERMSVEEFEQGKTWLNDTFHLIRCEDDCLPSIKWVLELAKAAVLRHGVRGLVIDPYNELDHQRPPNQTETEYVSQMLTKIKRFAQHHACHVWFVAHPRQLQHWVGGPPNLYDISGSAHFINKCDNGIVVHRNRDENAGPLDGVQICIRKVRNKVIGNIGDAFLSYNRTTGEFVDIDDAASRK